MSEWLYWTAYAVVALLAFPVIYRRIYVDYVEIHGEWDPEDRLFATAISAGLAATWLLVIPAYLAYRLLARYVLPALERDTE